MDEPNAIIVVEKTYSFHCHNCHSLDDPAWFSLDEWDERRDYVFCPRCGLELPVYDPDELQAHLRVKGGAGHAAG